jgi:hypothetical protein
MNLYPNVFCAKNKDCKGKGYKFLTKKSLTTKMRPKILLSGYFLALVLELTWI